MPYSHCSSALILRLAVTGGNLCHCKSSVYFTIDLITYCRYHLPLAEGAGFSCCSLVELWSGLGS